MEACGDNMKLDSSLGYVFIALLLSTFAFGLAIKLAPLYTLKFVMIQELAMIFFLLLYKD